MTEKSPDNRRRFHRIFFDARCELHWREESWPTHLLDISMKGVLVQRPENWTVPLNESFEVTIYLNDETSAIIMAVELRHIAQEYLGFSCRYIDLESAEHLKRLVELNLGDPALLGRELQYLGEAP